MGLRAPGRAWAIVTDPSSVGEPGQASAQVPAGAPCSHRSHSCPFLPGALWALFPCQLHPTSAVTPSSWASSCLDGRSCSPERSTRTRVPGACLGAGCPGVVLRGRHEADLFVTWSFLSITHAFKTAIKETRRSEHSGVWSCWYRRWQNYL